MFSLKPQLKAGAEQPINNFVTQLETLKQKVEKSIAATDEKQIDTTATATLKAIKKIQEIFKKIYKSPEAILDIAQVINADALVLLVTNAEYRELLEDICDFMQHNPLDTLFGSLVVMAVQTKWDQAIDNLRLTYGFCSFIAKSDDFSQAFSPDEKKPGTIDHLKSLISDFDYTKNLIGSLVQMQRKKVALSAEDLDNLIQEYHRALQKFIAEKWDEVCQLPYYRIRAVLPKMLTAQINEEDWLMSRMIIQGCREAILQQLLDIEDGINDLKPHRPVTSAHDFVQQITTAETTQKQVEALKKDFDKQFEELLKNVNDYLKPKLFSSSDPRKIKILTTLKENLEECANKHKNKEIGYKLKRVFKLVIRACIWHSKILADSMNSDKPLSSARTGEILRHHYDAFFKMYLSLNEVTSEFYAAHNALYNHTGFKSTEPPVVKIPPLTYKNTHLLIPVELQRFNTSYEKLCGVIKAEKLIFQPLAF